MLWLRCEPFLRLKSASEVARSGLFGPRGFLKTRIEPSPPPPPRRVRYGSRATDSTRSGLASRNLVELCELIGQVALAEGAGSWCSASGGGSSGSRTLGDAPHLRARASPQPAWRVRAPSAEPRGLPGRPACRVIYATDLNRKPAASAASTSRFSGDEAPWGHHARRRARGPRRARRPSSIDARPV